jgi:ketosteroid isomerase-like protein
VSEADVDVLRDQFEAVNERDFERAMNHYADDVVLVIEEGFLNLGTFEGKEAVGEWFGDWFRAFGSDYRFEIMEARELAEGLIFLHAMFEGSGRVSGVVTSDEAAYLYRVQGSKIRRAQIFPSKRKALEAASLPEWSGAQTD